ncbi:MAG: hypothetical protein WC329_06935 [Candidatus Omnitrophota bacterium]|nr:hypothetical protein [Candidatus Neomarinimicrobiota bacterium]
MESTKEGLDLPRGGLCSTHYQVTELPAIPATSNKPGPQRFEDWLYHAGYVEDAEKLSSCALRFEHWACPNGHDFYFRKYCGREYCPVCGAKGSYYHNRRVTRAAEHFIWAVTWGNLTFTMPKEISQRHLDKSQLRKLQNMAWEVTERILKTEGASVTVHLLGDRSPGLHVHFEVLFHRIGCFNKGMITRPQLKAIKKVWAILLSREFKLCIPSTDVRYSFAAARPKKWHKLNYILRPICTEDAMLALDDVDRHYIMSLKGYHRTRWFGQLANNKVNGFLRKHWAPVKLRETPLIEKRVCPMCKKKMKYQDTIFESDIPAMNVTKYNSDIYMDKAVDAFMRQEQKGGP